jgi:hypothetical protein
MPKRVQEVILAKGGPYVLLKLCERTLFECLKKTKKKKNENLSCFILSQLICTLLYNRIHMEGRSRVQIADRCAPWKISNSRESFYVGIAVLRVKCLPLIPRRDRHKSLLI